MPTFVKAFGDNLAAAANADGTKTLAVTGDAAVPSFLRAFGDNLAANDNLDGTKTLLVVEDEGVAAGFVKLAGDNLRAVANADGTKTLVVSGSGGNSALANFTLSPTTPDTATLVTATYAGGGTVIAYQWNIDGTVYTTASPTHTFATPGTKTVSLSVVLNDGKTYARTKAVTVTNPLALAGAVFDAIAHPVYCRSDAANTVACGDGDAIRWWQDAVSGTWAEVATSGARPVLRRVSGQWRAQFAGAGTYFEWPLGFSNTNRTVAAVWSETAYVQGAGVCSLRPASGSDFNTSPGFLVERGSGGSSEATAARVTTTAGTSVTALTGTTTPTVWNSTVVTCTPSLVRGYRDGTAFNAGSVVTGTGATTAAVLVGVRYLSGAINGAFSLQGYVGEVAIFAALDDATRQAREADIRTRWGTP